MTETKLAEAFEPDNASAVESDDTDIVETEKTEPELIKRELKARDVRRFAKILGKVREMSVARANAIASAEGRTDNDPPVQVDAITMLLTDGLEYAEKEINLWFAELCGVELSRAEKEAYRKERAEVTGDPEYKLSKWDVENAVSEKIADMSIDFYTDVLAELQQFGKLGRFLTGLTRLSQQMGFSNRNSTN